MLDTIDEATSAESGNDIIVRLLLSVDRSGSLEEAVDTVKLAHEYTKRGVVGIDFSGNPNVKRFHDFLPAFELARSFGLSTTVHTAEIWDKEDTSFIVEKFRPERMGHAVCLYPQHIKELTEKPIPIEICPTSNIKTESVSSFPEHPFGDFMKLPNYPLVICTDDSGVFNITLSSEYLELANAFHLSREVMRDVAMRPIDFIFAGEQVKEELRALFQGIYAKL